MLKPDIQEALEFVGRQLSFLAQRPDFRINVALDRIAAAGDAPVKQAVATIKTGRGSLTNSGYASLFEIIQLSKPDSTTGDIIVAYGDIRDRIEQEITPHILSLRSSFLYFASLLLVALIVCGIFETSVATSLRSVFDDMEHQLPELTAFMIERGARFGLFTLIAVSGILALTGFALYKLYNDLMAFRYTSINPLWFWGGKRILAISNAYILLAYMDLLVRAGHAPQDIETQACKLAGTEALHNGSVLPPSIHKPLSFALTNDTYQEELAFHLKQSPTQLLTAISDFRSTFSVTLQSLLFVLIGGLVIAYYLPIFALGSMV